MLIDDPMYPHRADLGSLKHRRTLRAVRMLRNAIDGELLTGLRTVLPANTDDKLIIRSTNDGAPHENAVAYTRRMGLIGLG